MREVKIGTLNHEVPKGFVAVYCGRSGKGLVGKYGNPFSTKDRGTRRNGSWIYRFEEYLDENPQLIEDLKNEGEKLFLQCFCKKEVDDDTLCHCDYLRKRVLCSSSHSFTELAVNKRVGATVNSVIYKCKECERRVEFVKK